MGYVYVRGTVKPPTFRGEVKNAAKEGFLENVQQKFSGSGSSGGSGNKPSIKLFPLIVILIIFYLIGGFFIKTQETGVAYYIFGPAQKIIEPLQSFGNFLFRGLRDVQSFVETGDTFFTFKSGGAEVKKKTGLSFRDMTSFGGFVGEDFGVDGKLIIGRLDEDIKVLRDVKLSCEVETVRGKIELRNQEYPDEAVFDIYNQGERYDEIVEPIHCTFDGTNTKLIASMTKQINAKDVKIELTYPFSVTSSLEIFVMPEQVSLDYRGREDEAFDDLSGGAYKSYNSEILSKMKFISDVETSLEFDKQPLGVGNSPNLRFAFRNSNTKNEVDIDRYTITLPPGMKFVAEECAVLDIQSNVGTLKTSRFEEIERRLNSESIGESGSLTCKVFIDDSARGGSTSSLIPAGKITSILDYKYTLNQKQTVVVKKAPTTSQPPNGTLT